MLAKLILDPTEGLPTLQEFAKRCQKIADISDKLEDLGWEVDSDIGGELFVVVSPPQDIDNEEELITILETLEIDYTGVGYVDTEYDDDDDLLDEFEEMAFEEMYEENDEDFYDDESFVHDLLDEEDVDSLVGRTINSVDCICDCITLHFADGGQLTIEACEAFLE